KDAPGREFGVGRGEHRVTRPRILEPLAARAQIRRAQLPLTQRILDTGDEASLLFLVTDLEPIFDKLNPAIDNEQLELRPDLAKAAALLLFAEAEPTPHSSPDAARRR